MVTSMAGGQPSGVVTGFAVRQGGLLRAPPSMPPEKGPRMNEKPNDDHSRRRRLRLGALLFRLGYYMQAPDDIAAAIYRYSPDTYVQVVGTMVRLVAGQHEVIVDLEEAIVCCKAALTGAPLHRLG